MNGPPRGESGETEITASSDAAGQTARTALQSGTGRGSATARSEAMRTQLDAEELTGLSPASRTGSASSASGALTGELRIGTLFAGRYEILSILGQGGMGRVYKARDRELDRLIALKTIRLDTAEGPEALARFKQELLLARKVTHKNVVRIFDLGEAEGIKFFTMEYIPGDSLKAFIRRRGKLPAREAATVGRQILSALEEAHAQGIVHRDLKPQNVMIEAEHGSAHLMDFGIARATEETGMTATGAIVGTPDYMSPEQVKGEKAGTASDVFAFGVILYEMLTGELPYQADSPMSKVMMRLSHRPRPVRELSADVPKYLDRVVRRCLEIDPVLRYQRAGEVLADLERESASLAYTMRFRRTVRQRRRWIAGAAVAAALLAAGSWAVVLRARPTANTPSAAVVATGPVHTLAILPLTNASGSRELDWLREGLADMLVTDLSQSRYVRPVPADRVYRVLREIGSGERTRFDESALEAVSQRAPAETVLHGQFVQSGSRVRLDLVLRRAGSGVPQPIKAEGDASQVLELVDQIAREVKQRLDLTPEQIRGDTARPFSEVATANVPALQAYQDGLAQSRAGSAQGAVARLKAAVAADPAFAMAWTRLAEAYLDAGEQREAEAAVDRALSLAEKAPLPLAQRYQVHAIAASVKEDLATAAASYRELATLYPDDPDVQYRLASTYRAAGKPAQAMPAYQRVLQLAPGYGAAEIELAGVYWQAGRSEDAIRTLNGTLAAGRFANDTEALGTIHSILGNAYRDTARIEEARSHLTQSLDYRRRAGDRRGQVVTLTNLASVHSQAGAVDEALGAEKEALAIARDMRDRTRESFVLNNMGLTYSAAGRLDEALASFRASLQIERERGAASEIANRLDKVADAYRLLGRYDDALVYLEQAKALLAKIDAKQEVGINQTFFGQVYEALGQYREALAAFQVALPIFQQIGQSIGVGAANAGLASVYARQGRYGDAWRALKTAVATYETLNAEHDIAEVKAPLGRLAAVLGRADDAEALLGETGRFAGHSHAGGLEVEVRLGQAELLRLRGLPAEAARVLQQAAAQARASGHRRYQVEAQGELADVQLQLGRTGEALALAQKARAAAADLRLRPLEARALAVLAAAQLASRRPEEARRAALDAISMAERFEGRPVLLHARATLARALGALGREAESRDAWTAAAADFEWLRGSAGPEHAEAFMARADVRALRAAVVAGAGSAPAPQVARLPGPERP